MASATPRLRPGNHQARTPKSLLVVPGIAVVAAGLLPGFHGNLFFLTDIILVGLLPVAWSRARHVRSLQRFVQLCALGAASQVVSNLMNGVPTGDLLGGVWQPVLLATSVVGLFWFADGNPRNTAVILAATFTLLVAAGAIGSSSVTSNDPWKYRFGIPITLLIVLATGFLWMTHHTVATYMLTVGLGCMNIILGFRSLGAVCIVGASLLAIISLIKRADVLRVSLAVIAGLLVSVGTSHVYGALAESGRLGYAQQAKYEAQTRSSAGLLLAARPEALLSLRVIIDHPLFGLGAGSRLDYAITEQLLEAAAEQGVELSPIHQERLLGDGVDSHSLALGAWVQAGVLAVLPWLYLIVLVLRSSFAAFVQEWSFLRPITVVWTVLCIWDFLFSPWSPHYQVLLGSFVVLIAGRLAAEDPSNRRSPGTDPEHRPPQSSDPSPEARSTRQASRTIGPRVYDSTIFEAVHHRQLSIKRR
jgi:hypothetical protein